MEKWRQKLTALAAEDLSMSAMSRETGLDHRTVKRYIQRMGLKLKKSRKPSQTASSPSIKAIKALRTSLERLGQDIGALMRNEGTGLAAGK